jgi:hypothetical protein
VGALLILPIQRPPRYTLLLREVIKYTSPDHRDLPALQQVSSSTFLFLGFFRARRTYELRRNR